MMSENRKKRIRITIAMLSAGLCFVFCFLGVNKIEAAAAGKTNEVSTDDASSDGNITSQLQGPEDGSIIPEVPGDGIAIPDGFTESDYIANDKTITAYQSQSLPEDFYLFYAMNNNGEEGWYLYDSTEGTYQRYVLETSGQVTEDTTTTEDEGATTDSDDQKMTNLRAEFKASNNFRLVIIGVMLVICVIMAGVIIYLSLALRDLKSGIDYDESEDYSDEDEDELSDTEEFSVEHPNYEDTEEEFYELEEQDDAANDDASDDENDEDEIDEDEIDEDEEEVHKSIKFIKKKNNKTGNNDKPDNRNGKRTEGINSIEITFIDLD